MTPNGTKIKALRTARGMTLRDLAAATGLDNGNLSRIERGTRGVRPKTLATLADFYGTTIDALRLRRPPTRRHPDRNGGPTRHTIDARRAR
ncbi:helix-turn-helix domain-containing protein [Embleya scabrispora]|uniref:helix-turn-helix domain-containing protein n=1 Tax=Embleya scabrispora TaxID=159449 RepID=UPI0013751BEA|nr:helix-turn-helix transcriptional regulator [Embleya scabrispora]